MLRQERMIQAFNTAWPTVWKEPYMANHGAGRSRSGGAKVDRASVSVKPSTDRTSLRCRQPIGAGRKPRRLRDGVVTGPARAVEGRPRRPGERGGAARRRVQGADMAAQGDLSNHSGAILHKVRRSICLSATVFACVGGRTLLKSKLWLLSKLSYGSVMKYVKW